MKKFPKPWFRANRGVWYVTVRGRQHNLGPDEAEAFRRYHQLMGQRPEKPQAADSALAVFDRFLAWCREHRKPDTYEWYRWRLQEFASHLHKAGLAALGVAQLKPFHLDEWLATRADWVNGTKHGMCRAVQRALRWAEKKGYIDRSPLAHYEKPRPGKRTTVITPAEYDTILAHAGGAAFRDLLEVTWETGCRPQESLAVEARHVDLANARWVFPPDESKGEQWPRIVYLTDKALAITCHLMADHPDGALFRNSGGQPWTTDAVNCAFIRLQTKLGMAKVRRLGLGMEKLPRLNGCTPEQRAEHDRKLINRRKTVRKLARQNGMKYCLYLLRHAWTDRALKSGIDSLTVAILLGHRDPGTLARTYQHLTQSPDYLKEAARKAGRSKP